MGATMTRAFIAASAASHAARTPTVKALPSAALSATAMTIPHVAHAAEGSGVGRCIDGISRQPEVADDLRGVLLLSLAFMESLTIYGLVIALVLLFANPLIK